MYLPAPFRVEDRRAIFDLIASAPFAALVTADDPFCVSHLPLGLHPGDGGWGCLRGHMARANGHWRRFATERPSLAVFSGPHAYVSPRWYENDDAPPTWNYAVVHVWGRPSAVEDPVAASAILDDLVGRHEEGEIPFSEQTRSALERRIVAFEMPIERVEAKFKLGQNREPADRSGVVEHLEQGGDVARELAGWTRRLTGLS